MNPTEARFTFSIEPKHHATANQKRHRHKHSGSLCAIVLLLAILLSACAAKPSHTEESAPYTEAEENSSFCTEEPVLTGYDASHPLHGMLTLPNDTQNPPVALLLQGSGAVSMDSPIGKAQNRPLADLAYGLARRGIASLRYDKRSYSYPDAVTDIQTEYLWDVKAAVTLLKNDARLDSSQIYLIGHSQGGMMGPLLITENPEFRGFVSLGGSLVRLEDKILEQAITLQQQDGSISEAEREANIDAVKADVTRIKALTGEAGAAPDRQIQGYPETYWKSINAMNSYELAAQLASQNFPMLILQGKNDFQVLYNHDFALWKEALRTDENAAFRAYDGLSHVFMPGRGARFDSSDYDAPAHMDPQVINDIADWILSQP